MFKHAIAACVMATIVAGAAGAAPAKAKAKPAPKLTEVKVCPMTDEAVKGKGAGSEVVGKYKVYFCCAGCQPEFDKLSKADKQKKIAAALDKQKASAKPKG